MLSGYFSGSDNIWYKINNVSGPWQWIDKREPYQPGCKSYEAKKCAQLPYQPQKSPQNLLKSNL